MPEEAVSLRSAVEAAAADQNIKEKKDETEEIKSENEQDSKAEVKADETPQTEGFEVDPEIEEAVNFYRALRDPNQQNNIIAELANRAGLLKKNEQLTTREEKKYGDLLNEILGEEYPDLKDKLGKVFSAFESESDRKLLGLRAEIEHERQIKAVSEFETEFSSFISDNKITEDEAAKMLKEIEVLPPTTGRNGKRISLTQYLGKIHRLVAGEKREIVKEVDRAKKIEKNLKERSTHLSSDIGDDRIKKGSSLPSIKESIRAAAEGVKFDT